MDMEPQVPQKARPFELAATNMMCQQLADNVWGVMADNVAEVDHTATNAGFVAGTRGVLAIESLSNRRLCGQLLGWIEHHTGRSPRYLVNTSFHGDHAFGNFALPEDTTVIVHRATAAHLAVEFDDELAHMIDFMGGGDGLDEVVPRPPDILIDSPVVVDLGDVEVEIEPIGFIQTTGDLAVHVRDRGVVFVGNALNGPPPTIPWLADERIDGVINSYQRLRDRLDPDTVIVTGHGRPMRPRDIDYSIGYLEDLQRVTDAHRDRGEGRLEVAANPELLKYSGYSMFELAHLRVNLGALFGDSTESAIAVNQAKESRHEGES